MSYLREEEMHVITKTEKLSPLSREEFLAVKEEFFKLLQGFYLDHPQVLISASLSCDHGDGKHAFTTHFVGYADPMQMLQSCAYLEKEAIDSMMERSPGAVKEYAEWLKEFLGDRGE